MEEEPSALKLWFASPSCGRFANNENGKNNILTSQGCFEEPGKSRNAS